MSPIWFRLALVMLAISTATFAAVDQTLLAFQSAPQATRVMTAMLETPPLTETGTRPAPLDPPAASRSLFAVVDDLASGSSQGHVYAADADLSLRGVVITGARRRALIASEIGDDGEWFSAGERVAGAVVEIIQPRRVFLRRDGDGFWINLATAGG